MLALAKVRSSIPKTALTPAVFQSYQTFPDAKTGTLANCFRRSKVRTRGLGWFLQC